MWITKAILAAALLLGAAACGDTSGPSAPPAYVPDSLRAEQEREAVQEELLRSELPGSDWSITALAGVPIMGANDPTLSFTRDGTVSGSTGCNQFGGSWTLEQSRIDIGELEFTEMACDEPVMMQESRVLSILDNAILAGIGDTGTLFLTTLDGDMITAERAAP